MQNHRGPRQGWLWAEMVGSLEVEIQLANGKFGCCQLIGWLVSPRLQVTSRGIDRGRNSLSMPSLRRLSYRHVETRGRRKTACKQIAHDGVSGNWKDVTVWDLTEPTHPGWWAVLDVQLVGWVGGRPRMSISAVWAFYQDQEGCVSGGGGMDRKTVWKVGEKSELAAGRAGSLISIFPCFRLIFPLLY